MTIKEKIVNYTLNPVLNTCLSFLFSSQQKHRQKSAEQKPKLYTVRQAQV